jgi:two-component system nitrate/nitrite response regulator NarL
VSAAEPEQLRAVVVDDHRLLAQSIAVALTLEGVACSVAEVSSPEQIVADLSADPPDVVLLDLDLGPEVGDGGRLVRPLVGNGCRVLVLSATTDPARMASALEDGAAGVLPKTEPIEVLLAASSAAARGEGVMRESERRAVLRDATERRARRAATLAPFDRLTEREAQVLRALGSGTAVSAIAERWHVSEATVRSQVRGVLTKLGVGSQLEAVALAHETGWLTTGSRGVVT